jgi:hypothetical protein
VRGANRNGILKTLFNQHTHRNIVDEVPDATRNIPQTAMAISFQSDSQDDLAMFKGRTKFEIIVSFPARLDRVLTYSAAIRISRLSRRQRENLRTTGDVLLTDPLVGLNVNHALGGIPDNDGDWTAQATPLRGAPGLESQPNREPRWMATS